MEKVKKDITMIPVLKTTREELKKIGAKGETYDDIIRRFLALAKK